MHRQQMHKSRLWQAEEETEIRARIQQNEQRLIINAEKKEKLAPKTASQTHAAANIAKSENETREPAKQQRREEETRGKEKHKEWKESGMCGMQRLRTRMRPSRREEATRTGKEQ